MSAWSIVNRNKVLQEALTDVFKGHRRSRRVEGQEEVDLEDLMDKGLNFVQERELSEMQVKLHFKHSRNSQDGQGKIQSSNAFRYYA
jgi:hypothetical protein